MYGPLAEFIAVMMIGGLAIWLLTMYVHMNGDETMKPNSRLMNEIRRHPKDE